MPGACRPTAGGRSNDGIDTKPKAPAPGVRPWLSIDDIGRVIGVCKMYQWAMEMETTAKIGSGAGFVKDVREAKIAADAFEKYQKAFDKLIYTDGFNRRIVPDEDPDSADFGD